MLFAMPPVTGRTQEPGTPADPNAFSIQVYRLPTNEFTGDLEHGFMHPPKPPDAKAGTSEIDNFLRRSHEFSQAYLKRQGVTLTEGSLACLDPATGTLALRAPNGVHERVLAFACAMERTLPLNISWSLSIIETEAAVARTAIKEASGSSDHTAVFDRLLPASKVVVTMHGITTSGVPIKAVEGARADDLAGFTLDSRSRVKVHEEKTVTGTELEMEPTIDADGESMDLALSLRHRHAHGSTHREHLMAAAPQKHEVSWIDRPLAEIKTAIRLLNGSTRLLGTFALDGEEWVKREEAVRVAFIRASLVKIQPLADGFVLRLLRSRGETVEPTPKNGRSDRKPDVLPGMKLRRFRVPPDFLSLGIGQPDSSSAADPFAGDKSIDGKPPVRKTAEEILRDQGIPFPSGASASFYQKASELIVFNTQDALDLVEALCCGWDCDPALLSFSLHIVQAKASLLRKLDRDTFSLPDHSVAWKELEDAVARGEAKIVRSTWIETKSGQQCTTQSVLEYRHADSLGPESSTGSTDSKKSADGDSAESRPVVTAGATNDTALESYRVTSSIHPIGLRCVMEPTLSADDQTIDLNLAVDFDYAPPVQRLFDEPLPEHTIRIASPATEFHRHEFKTSITTRSGATRLLSIWKPSGSPDRDGDVLQAAFIRADVVTVKPDEK